MQPTELADKLNAKLLARHVPSRVLISRFRLLDENSRVSHASLDPLYIPFFYHLGKLFPAKNLMEFGFGIGLTSACYLMAHPQTESLLAFQQMDKVYYSTRLGAGNIRLAWRKRAYRIHVGSVHDAAFEAAAKSRRWNLVLMNERLGYDEHLQHLTVAWENLAEGGLIAMDYAKSHAVGARVYEDFCKVRQRSPVVVKTRYGVGLLMK